jgi:hypothetical protein
MTVKSAIADRPHRGFCIKSLLASKYEGLGLAALQVVPFPLYNIEALVHFGARDIYSSRRML